jgi:cell division protease FtsH
VIVVLVYLASQTLLDQEGDGEQAIAYSELKQLVRTEPESITEVVFVPRRNGIDVRLANGETLEAHYPSDESQLAFEQLLEENDVAHDSRGTGESAWWSILTYLLPFVLFVGFWIFLMRQVQGRDDKGFIRRRSEAD